MEYGRADRRQFLKGTACVGAATALAGCLTTEDGFRAPDRKFGFAAPALERVRVGLIGLGHRGSAAVRRLAIVPGMEIVALCDLYPERVERQQAWLEGAGLSRVRGYSGDEGYKALCESELDLVYVTSPWRLHVPMALYAMEHGKHVAVEVPAAMTVEDCWALVKTAERTQLHCVQLENCCYGEAELLCLNLARQGLLGEILHGEGAYIHDLRTSNYKDPAKGGYQGYWRLKWNTDHVGNPYPTHGLGPLMQVMDINRGDRFDYLNCLQCDPHCNDLYGAAKFGADSWQGRLHPACGDLSTTVIRTVKGRTILVQHDVNTPRPYSRLNLVQGTRGIFSGISFAKDAEAFFRDGCGVRFCWEEQVGDGVHKFFDFAKVQSLRETYRHPLWKASGAQATKQGGHGGMDYLMDLRLAHCLTHGLPTDMDVYDLAASCSLVELSERSCRDRGNSQEIPDFTCGGWREARPCGLKQDV